MWDVPARLGILRPVEDYVRAIAGIDPPGDMVLQRGDGRQSTFECSASTPVALVRSASDAQKSVEVGL